MSSTNELVSNLNGNEKSSFYNLNFKTIFLVVILICACCLLSIGYNFNINNLFTSGISMVACCVLVLFLFYVFYEFFKGNDCEELNKNGLHRLASSASRGADYFGQQASRGMSAMNSAMNYASTPSQIKPMESS